MNDLLACPFCGSGRLENLDNIDGAVFCIDCGARGPIPSKLRQCSAAEVDNNEEAWNTRQDAF